MLVISCSGCKTKLWKYDKIGKGRVLRCHKDRIQRFYKKPILDKTDGKVKCNCGKEIGIDKGSFIKMNKKAFTYTGTKRPK